MKLFEIGDGLKSIKAPSKYYSDLQDDATVILHTGDDTAPLIRITVTSGEPKDNSSLDNIYNYVIRKGEEAGHSVALVADKSYYQEIQKSVEDSSLTFFYHIGYKYNYILISVTASANSDADVELQNTLKEVEQMISTITEISLDKQTIFQPRCTDFNVMVERISSIQGFALDDIDQLHKDEKTLFLLQDLIDKGIYTSDQTYELQSLGIALGDYMQYKSPDLHWAVVCDEYGRDLCLQYQNLSLTVFPMTMISKRIEDGEEVNVKYIVETLFDRIIEMARDGDIAQS